MVTPTAAGCIFAQQRIGVLIEDTPMNATPMITEALAIDHYHVFRKTPLERCERYRYTSLSI